MTNLADALAEGAIHEQAAAKVLLVLNDPVTAAVPADTKQALQRRWTELAPYASLELAFPRCEIFLACCERPLSAFEVGDRRRYHKGCPTGFGERLRLLGDETRKSTPGKGFLATLRRHERRNKVRPSSLHQVQRLIVEKRTVLRLSPRIAPVKVAVLPARFVRLCGGAVRAGGTGAVTRPVS